MELNVHIYLMNSKEEKKRDLSLMNKWNEGVTTGYLPESIRKKISPEKKNVSPIESIYEIHAIS